MTRILGLSAFFHDSAACLVVDGEIVAAAQEERFSRKKHDPSFPSGAVRFCLEEAGIGVDDLDFVGFYEKPLAKFDRLLETYLDFAPRGFPSFLKAMPAWMKEKLWLPDVVRQELAGVEGIEALRERKRRAKEYRFRLLFGDHHESHAASAFYPSPFEEAAIVTADGVGEWATSSIGVGRGGDLELLEELRFPASLGLFYSAITYYTGFRVNSGEYKVMGLAPYGEPRFVDELKRTIAIADDGSLALDQRYFDYCAGLRMTGRRFHDLLGGPPRQPESRVTQREMDIARSAQAIVEEAMTRMAAHAKARTGLPNLCLAGGVALNCVANGRLLREGPFDEIWIQPAAGDAGGALGVALAIWHRYLGQPRRSAERAGTWVARRGAAGRLLSAADAMKGARLGPADSLAAIDRFLAERALPHEQLERAALSERVAGLLAEGKIVGFHQGRMEFGPRALGARSILGDPRSPTMQSRMNLAIKYRESFRPFAPCVLREAVADWFDLDAESPYMLLVAPVAERRRRPAPAGSESLEGIAKLQLPRSEIPAVTHVDFSARIQTVRDDTHPELAGVLRAFARLTGCPVLVNTSFNVRGEPIVGSIEDSYRCFMRTEIDALALETRLLLKGDQPPYAEAADWRSRLELD